MENLTRNPELETRNSSETSTWNLERLSAEAGRWALAKADGTWNSSETSEFRGEAIEN
jgi:hypothetical protein